MLSARSAPLATGSESVKKVKRCSCGLGYCGGASSAELQPVEGEQYGADAIRCVAASTGESVSEVVGVVSGAWPKQHAAFKYTRSVTADSYAESAPKCGRYGSLLPGASAFSKPKGKQAKAQLLADAKGGRPLSKVTVAYVEGVLRACSTEGAGTYDVAAALAVKVHASLLIANQLTDGALALPTLWGRFFNGTWHRQHFQLTPPAGGGLVLRTRAQISAEVQVRIALHTGLHPPSALERHALTNARIRPLDLDTVDAARGRGAKPAPKRRKTGVGPLRCPGVDHDVLYEYVRAIALCTLPKGTQTLCLVLCRAPVFSYKPWAGGTMWP